MKYAVVTFGCRVNQADSLAIEGELRSRGAEAARAETADLIVVNTCSVTASADQAARQMIRHVARLNPRARIVVTGCYATRRPDEIAALPNVARVITNREKEALVSLIATDVGLTTADRFGGGDGPCGSALAPGVAGRTAFTLRVQTGCDQQCSYCIIPRTRGRARSRPLAQILRDVEVAAAAGYKEIAITGVHLGSYGRDLGDGSALPALVRALAAIDGDVLFRISSLEPMDCTTEVVDLVASSPRLAPHFHLPLQHGSDGMLRLMRRPYSVSYYRDLVRRIRAMLPDASIGTDVIVGFPGESEAQFIEMREVLAELPLTHLHVFPYSDRPGTEAARLRPKVEGGVIRARGRVIRGVGEQLARRFRQSQVGRCVRGLTVDDGQSVVTENYLKLRLDVMRTRNEWISVRVEDEVRGSVST
jgi:threonylcarbamoyladenosine tRNA methylthiotransferase MtaB